MKPALALLSMLWVASCLWLAQSWQHRPTRHYEITIDSLKAVNASQFTALRGAVEMASRYASEAMWAEGKLNQVQAQCW